jgi:hypothetical protein
MPRCTGRSSRTGKPCKKDAIKGGTVCSTHGGKAPQVKAAAERRQQEAAAEIAIVAYGIPREIDPHNALLHELYRTHGHITWLEQQISALEADSLHGPVGGGENSIPRHEPHVLIRMCMDERKHYAAVARDCIKAGIEQRRMELTEQLAEQIAAFARGVMDDLGINPNSEKARVAFRKHLTLLAGGNA